MKINSDTYHNLLVRRIKHVHEYRFTRVFEEFKDSNVTPMLHLGINALYQIATLPQEEREK